MKRQLSIPRTALAVVLGLAMAVTAAPSAAFAAAEGQCYSRGGYSFKWFSSPDGNSIWVYGGTQCDGEIAVGRAKQGVDNSVVKLSIKDLACDNRGFTLWVHGHRLNSSTCNNTEEVGLFRSGIGHPQNFWVQVGGTSVNSDALAIP